MGREAEERICSTAKNSANAIKNLSLKIVIYLLKIFKNLFIYVKLNYSLSLLKMFAFSELTNHTDFFFHKLSLKSGQWIY